MAPLFKQRHAVVSAYALPLLSRAKYSLYHNDAVFVDVEADGVAVNDREPRVWTIDVAWILKRMLRKRPDRVHEDVELLVGAMAGAGLRQPVDDAYQVMCGRRRVNRAARRLWN